MHVVPAFAARTTAECKSSLYFARAYVNCICPGSSIQDMYTMYVLTGTHAANLIKCHRRSNIMKNIIKAYNSTSLIIRIAIGLVIGAVLASVSSSAPFSV